MAKLCLVAVLASNVLITVALTKKVLLVRWEEKSGMMLLGVDD